MQEQRRIPLPGKYRSFIDQAISIAYMADTAYEDCLQITDFEISAPLFYAADFVPLETITVNEVVSALKYTPCYFNEDFLAEHVSTHAPIVEMRFRLLTARNYTESYLKDYIAPVLTRAMNMRLHLVSPTMIRPFICLVHDAEALRPTHTLAVTATAFYS